MSGETSETWNVIALGFDAPDEVVIDGLQRVFGVDYETAQRVVRSTPRAVKHDVPRETALWYGQALAAIGGRYELQPSANAFIQTSAGEHVSPTLRRAHGVVPEQLEAPGQIGAEAMIGEAVESGLEIDMMRSQRPVKLGNRDARDDDKGLVIARAGVSSRPPAGSQSLPPPRAGYSLPPSPKERSRRTGPSIVLGIGVTLFVLGVVGGSTYLVGPLRIGAPILQAVGALLFARGAWKLFTS